MTASPNPFADEPRPPGAVRLQAEGDPQNPYASPAEVAEEKTEPPVGIWRDGELLVIHDWVTSLPNRCVFTNELLTVRCRQELSWANSIGWRSRYLPLNFGVVEPILQKMVRRRHRWWLLAGSACLALVLIAATLVLIAATLGFFVSSPAVILGTILFSLLASGLLLQGAKNAENVFKIREINGPYFWLAGAGKPFLDSLPKWPGMSNH